MENSTAIKDQVRKKYDEIAAGSVRGCCGTAEVTMIGDDYDDVAGYVAEADLGLGCGVPTDVAGIREGHTVLDLGSGAGLDAFVARSIVGSRGFVHGVDMTPSMVERARANARRLDYENVAFHEGDIEDLPLENEVVDIVISNCVLNLVPDKEAAFSEIYRVLKTGGHFAISDIVVRGTLPESVRRSAELYAGCVAGALEESRYLEIVRRAGFAEVEVVKEKVIDIPDEALRSAAGQDEIRTFRDQGGMVLSITVKGWKQ